jgi:hypothetical protein
MEYTMIEVVADAFFVVVRYALWEVHGFLQSSEQTPNDASGATRCTLRCCECSSSMLKRGDFYYENGGS